MTELPTPSTADLDVGAVLAALADPLRRAVTADLYRRADAEHACRTFDLPVAKSTRTHHWRVLREAGIVRQRDLGNGSAVRLRRADLDERFPGLLASVVGAVEAERRPAAQTSST